MGVPAGIEIIILAAILGLGVLAVLFIVLRRRPDANVSRPSPSDLPPPVQSPPPQPVPLQSPRANDPAVMAGVLEPISLHRSRPGRAPAPALETLQPFFPDLELLGLIGQGGMGAVYRARRRADGAPLALKVVSAEGPDGEAFAARFLREAQALRRLAHPGIVAIHDHGRSGPWCWLLMDLIEGANLRQVVATGTLSASQALALVPPLCAALQYAHDQGVVHRDLKPENILIDQRGAPRLVDFGLAKLSAAAGDTLTGTGDRLGTMHYMAPEQVEGAREIDHRADIYALGVIIYELLTGRLPLGRFESPSERAAVDARIDEVVLRALERDPRRRWQSASQVGQAVAGISGAGPARPGAAAPAPAARDAAPAPRVVVASNGDEPRPWGMRVNDFAMLLHLALFAGYIVPCAGFVLTIVMWATCRDLHPAIDRHGRIAINWMLSFFVYGLIFGLLCFVLVGIPLLIALGICGVVFPIIGAIRASRGEVWNYPLNIGFMSVDPGPTASSGRTGLGGLAIGCLLVFVILGCLLAVIAVLGFTVNHASASPHVIVTPSGIQYQSQP